jgi:queuine tRNA-ribosyltransferase
MPTKKRPRARAPSVRCTFENDLDSLRLALLHPDLFIYLRHSGPAGIVKEGSWRSKQHPGLQWTLIQGDFLETMAQAPARPNLIFFDLFSSKTAQHHWTREAFQRVFDACKGSPAELLTYSCSTAVRASLLSVGFYVAHGCAVGVKGETTVALTPEQLQGPDAEATRLRYSLLSQEWLAKWERSQAKYPASVSAEDRPRFEATLLNHPQWSINGALA